MHHHKRLPCPITSACAVHASRQPACSADEWMKNAIEQVRQSIHDAMNRVDCLVIETGHADCTRMLLHTLGPYSRRQPDENAWLRFTADCGTVADDVPPWGPPALLSTIRGVVSAWPFICTQLLSELLTVHVAFLLDVPQALQRNPHGFGKFVDWCAGNLSLVAIVVSDAAPILKLNLSQVRIAVDTMVLPDRACVDTSTTLTTALLERASKGTRT